ncbi:MAG: hypothetical protein ACLFWF_04690 [Alphaproteobacteria bacterium]
MRFLPHLGAALLTFAVISGAAAEAPRGPLGGTYTQLTAKDLRLVEEATAKLLRTGRPGKMVSWENDVSGNSGTLKLEGRFREGNLPCRQVSHLVRYRDRADPQLLRLTFCRREGQWKLTG